MRFRRHLLIDSFQYRLLAANFVYFLTITGVLACVVFGPLVLSLQEEPTLALEQQEMANAFVYLDEHVWLTLMVLFVLFGVHSVLLSHRIAGPLYRFRKAFAAAARGDLSPVKLRKHDYMKSHVESINALFTSWEDRLAEIDDRCEDLARLVPQLREAASSQQDVAKSIEALEEAIRSLRASAGSVCQEAASSEPSLEQESVKA